MGAKKNFVLDTNVILHDYKCIENFQENGIYLPIVVLEELDKFKKGSDQINYNAREFVRELDYLQATTFFLKELLWVRVKEHSISLQATNIKRKLPCRFRKKHPTTESCPALYSLRRRIPKYVPFSLPRM